jgi:hypothetical protein
MKLLANLKWNRIAALTEVGTKYTQYITDLKTRMEANKMDFIVNEQFARDNDFDAFMTVSFGWKFSDSWTAG